MKSKGKIQFNATVRKEGGSYVISLPMPICKQNQIQEGDTIMFEQDHSQKIENMKNRENGDHFHGWNETVQSGERK